MKTRCRGEYYPPSHPFLIPKIKLLEREQKSYGAFFSIDFRVQLISVFYCNETDDSLGSARGMGNVFEANPSDSPEQPGQDHRAPDDSV